MEGVGVREILKGAGDGENIMKIHCLKKHTYNKMKAMGNCFQTGKINILEPPWLSILQQSAGMQEAARQWVGVVLTHTEMDMESGVPY